MLGSVLGNDGNHGGLGGVMDKFNQAGLGDAARSWVGTGDNVPVSGDQVSGALGQGTINDVAGKLGINPGMAASVLAAVLPAVIDRMTPHGQAPAGGLGSTGDILGQLGGLLGRR